MTLALTWLTRKTQERISREMGKCPRHGVLEYWSTAFSAKSSDIPAHGHYGSNVPSAMRDLCKN